MTIIISMTSYRRPEHTRRVLEALSKCRRCDDMRVLLIVDGGEKSKQDEICDVVSKFRFAESYYLSENAGCAGATGISLERAFATGAEFVIHLEDDTIPSEDFIEYMTWANERFKNDDRIFSVSGYTYRTDGPLPNNHPHTLKGVGDPPISISERLVHMLGVGNLEEGMG